MASCRRFAFLPLALLLTPALLCLFAAGAQAKQPAVVINNLVLESLGPLPTWEGAPAPQPNSAPAPLPTAPAAATPSPYGYSPPETAAPAPIPTPAPTPTSAPMTASEQQALPQTSRAPTGQSSPQASGERSWQTGYRQAAAASSSPESRGDLGLSVAVYGGLMTEGVFTDLLIKPWDTHFKDTKLLAISAAYRLYRFPFGLSFEVEAGAGRRFDDEEMWEFWTALGARWDNFPWNDYVKTTFGVAFFGPNYSTKISPHEEDRNDGKRTHWMNFFAPEITLAHPDLPQAALLLRLHHRSGMGGLYNDTTSGSTFLSAGTRLFF